MALAIMLSCLEVRTINIFLHHLLFEDFPLRPYETVG